MRMRIRIRRSKKGPATRVRVGVGGLLFVLLSLPLPLVAAPPKAKGRRPSLVHQAAATAIKDQASPAASASEEDPPTIDILKGQQTGQLSATAIAGIKARS